MEMKVLLFIDISEIEMIFTTATTLFKRVHTKVSGHWSQRGFGLIHDFIYKNTFNKNIQDKI